MTKQNLQRYREIMLEAEQLQEQMKRLESTIIFPSQKLKDLPPSSFDNNKMAKIVEKLLALQDLYSKKLSDSCAAQLEVESYISSLPEREQRLMRYRYIEGLTWEQVADKMHYSSKQIRRIHNATLDSMLY